MIEKQWETQKSMLVAGLLACWSTAAQSKPFYEKSEAMAPQGDDHTRGRGGGGGRWAWGLGHIYVTAPSPSRGGGRSDAMPPPLGGR